jgi:diguanylate cyclase (GGDEF)-like protein/PAS domain S-box-containing protein
MRACVLIIEGNPANLQVMTDLLRGCRCELLYAQDGEKGLALAHGARPDVVVCDIQLPRMDGFEVLRRLKSDAATWSIPVIAVSASPMAGGRDRALAAGFDGYIDKPLVPETFVSQLERFLRPQAEPQLEIEARFRQMAENIRDVFYLRDLETLEILYINEAYERIWGRSRESLYADGHSWVETIHADDLERVSGLFRESTATGEYDYEYRIVRPDGEVRWIHGRGFPIRDAAGKVYRIAGVAADITGRKRAEQLRALEHGVTRCLAGAESASAAIQAVIRTICEAEEWPCGRYFTADEAAGVLRFAEAWSTNDPAAEQFIARSRELVYRRGQGLSGIAWQAGQPLWVADLSKDARALGAWRSSSGPSLQGGCHILPVTFEGKTLGVLSFASAQAREPDERFLEATAVIGSQVGQFLARKQAETAMRNSEAALRRAELMAKVAHVVTGPGGGVESWSETFPQLIGADPGEVVRSTRDWLEFLHPDERDAFRQTSIEAAASGTRRDTEYRLRRGNGEWIHLRHVMEPLQSDLHGASGMRWFSTLQDITQEKRAEDKIRRLNRVYAVLSGINSLIVRARSRDELFKESCRIAVEDAKFQLAWIGIVDNQKEEIVPVASSGADQGFLRVIRLSTKDDDPERFGMAGRAIRDRAPVVSNEVATDPFALRRMQSVSRGFQSVAMLPLVVSGQAIGVLGLHAVEPGFFDHEEMNLLSELASDIAFALEHLEKEEKLRRLTRVNAVLSSINAAIVRIRGRQELFQEACRIAVEEGQFPIAWIGVVDEAAARVQPVVWQGTDEQLLGRIRMTLQESAPGGIGVVGRAVNEGVPVISNDLEHDPQVPAKGALERGARSLAALPLVVGGKAAAVLMLYAPVVGFFDRDEMTLLLELAGDLAFALDHIEKGEKLDYLAYYDALTGLANPTLFHERLAQFLSTAKAEGHRLALVLIDIERFKTINDSLGRHAGDELLKQVAARLTGDSADGTRFGHISADQFAVVVPEVRSDEEFGRIFEAQATRCFGAPYRLGDTELRVSVKAGIAMFPDDAADPEGLLKNAEAALKKAKASGERYLFYTQQMTERVAEKLALENQLRQGLEREQFVLHYQPKVDLEKRAIVGLEALIRWQSPERGLVPPGQFISLLEETGLILEVGAWALKRAALDHRNWAEQKLKPSRVAVNVSAIQLRQRDFVAVVEQAIMEGVAPTAIDLEITESLVMEDVEANIAKLKAVRELGVRIAIDDFGTGYSSLGYLAKLPVQALKIDRSFIVNMHGDPDAMSLISTIISLAHSLRLSVVAEGVETEEQAKFLRLLRCDEMQGYLFSKPVPFDEITRLLQKG